jgi:hypothetical protein
MLDDQVAPRDDGVIRILQEAGRPLSAQEIVEAIAEKPAQRRSGGQSFSDILVQVKPGYWGLLLRDFALRSTDVEELLEDAWAALGCNEAISVSELQVRIGNRGAASSARLSLRVLLLLLDRDDRFVVDSRGTVRLR